jgi:hypothetical protein
MRTLTFVVVLAAFTAMLFAQVPPDVKIRLFESGNEVGLVYRASGPEDATVYTEHWILYPTYVYPGPRSLATLKLTPESSTPYRSEGEFFKRAPFPKGSKYVRVTAEEFKELPAAR